MARLQILFLYLFLVTTSCVQLLQAVVVAVCAKQLKLL